MRKFLFTILILVVLSVIGGYAYLMRFIPNYNQQLAVEGLKAEVTIERNRFGVPTIIAQNDHDLYFAWGYVNAQDRLFQMEITRRIAQGRISEFAGASTLKKDIFLRAVGFYEIARQNQKTFSPTVRRFFQRYVDGINYFVNNEKAPLYMKLLGLKPEKWEIADATAVAMMLNWSLAYNMKHELIYYQIAKKLGKEKASELLNFVPSKTPTTVEGARHVAASRSLNALFREMGSLLGCTSASNGWVVAPSKTAHGGTILCSDMQVHSSKLPSDFYFIHVKAAEYDAAGAQVIGLPFIVSGYNRHIAWGNTNQGADLVDLFMETVDWAHKTYRYNGRDVPLKSRQEIFNIKGKDPVKKNIYYAGRKPILNDVFTELDFNVSLDWAGFDDINIEGFFHINRAEDYQAFVAGARQIRMSPQNMIYADRYGNIAYRVVGSLPKRMKGTGNFPQIGELVQANWKGNLSDDDYPSVKNPERGYIITANNKVLKDSAPEMNATFAPGYRYENVAAMIRDKDGIDVDYMKRVQTDTKTVLAAKVISIIQKYIRTANDPKAAKALELVLTWDGNNRQDDPAPAIYNTFLVRFMYHTLKDEIGEDTAQQYIAERYISMERFFELLKNKSDFFDDITTPGKEKIADIANRAFEETLQILTEYSGQEDVEKWSWGTFHVIRFDHFIGKSKLLAPFVNYGPFPFEGDGETNNRARFYGIEPPFVAVSASAPRIIVRFAPDPKGYMMLITGENEFFLSSHNTDMTDAWRRKEYFCMEEEKPEYRTVMIAADN
ncbi:MAG: penicillin acylase family protein [Desulfobacterales bacterium]|nr:penicillin acylase family protein [Desulfobacterales bacterium]